MRVFRGSRDSLAGSGGAFTGTVWTEEVAVPGAPSTLRIGIVRFAPGSRTIWHTHHRGQVLLITDGAGLVARRGHPPEPVHAGDAVVFEPGEWHWHGAGPATCLAHLAIQEADDRGVTAELGLPVIDTEYDQG